MVQRIISKSRFGEEAEEYLSLKGKTTRRIYGSAFNHFLNFYGNKYGKGKGFSDYLDRIFEELKKERRQQRRIAEIELVDFIDYLKQLEKSNNTIRIYFAAVQNFLKYKGIIVSSSFIGNLPPPVEKPINHKHEWTIEQIKKFVDSAPTYRDKAIAVCLFQSGLGVNELTQLNYEHIQDEFEKGILPICLKLVRQKTSVEFKTFFGADAVKYLRLYLETRKNLTPKTPLFTKWQSEERITPAAISQKFSEIAKDLPFIKKKDLEGFNPVRPHSLRAAFKSQLINIISDELIEFWMGHALGSTKDAYLNMPTKKLRSLYMDAEKHLVIEKTSQDEGLKVSADVEQKIKNLESKIEWWQKFMETKVEEVTRKLFKEWKAKEYEEIKQEDKIEEEFQKENSYSKEEKEAWRQQKKDSSTKTIKTDEEPKEDLYEMYKELTE